MQRDASATRVTEGRSLAAALLSGFVDPPKEKVEVPGTFCPKTSRPARKPTPKRARQHVDARVFHADVGSEAQRPRRNRANPVPLRTT